jgi:hypothetical protein
MMAGAPLDGETPRTLLSDAAQPDDSALEFCPEKPFAGNCD